MVVGARICPQCGTRVDERRARASPYCLSCGAHLGTAPPVGFGKKAGGGSSLPWILGGIAAFVGLGVVAVVVLLVAVAEGDPAPLAAVSTDAAAQLPPVLEPAPTAPAAPKPAPTVKAGVPAPRAPTAAPPPTVVGPVTPTASPTPAPTPAPATLGAFPRARATNELDRVTTSLGSCKSSGGPTGAGSIRVDFEPDGRIATLLRKPFAGTPTGSCIAGRFGAIRIGKFDGATQAIERTFTLD
jgi:hypothetical protein